MFRDTMRWHRRRSDDGTFASPRVAFVLSGGGSLGAMQCGQLRAVLEAGITPDLVIGVSAGALNGAAIAHEPTVEGAQQLTTIWKELRRDDVFARITPRAGMACVASTLASYRSDGLVDLVTRFLPLDDLSQLSTVFEAGTVNIDDARFEFHSTGDPRSVLVASASLPGVFEPVMIDGRRHVDGGIAVNLPIQRAHDLGATLILAFDCRAGTRHQLPVDLSALGVLTSSIVVAREILTPSHDHPNVVRLPAPDTHGIDVFDFSQSERLVTEGHELVARFLDGHPLLTALPSRSAA